MPAFWQAPGFPLPTTQFDAQVQYSGTNGLYPAALLAMTNHAGRQQIDVRVPWKVGPEVTSLIVSQEGKNGTQSVSDVDYWGDFFHNSSGSTLAVHEATGASVTAENPARVGEAVLLYLTNLPVTPGLVPPTGEPIDTGFPSYDYLVPLNELGPYTLVADGVTSLVGSAITYIELAPGSVGVYVMRLVVPPVKAAQ
jgi:uncharacterized protein (TIGR03437 family)